MRIRTAVVALALAALPARTALAQSASEHLAAGDKEHAAMNAAAALRHYEAAAAADPKNYEALWKGASEATDLAEFGGKGDETKRLYRTAELYARRAVEAKPADAEGHFQLARALGRLALTMGARDRVKYAGDVRAQALEALKYSPRHDGALHVMGMWNYNIMSLSGLTRAFAKTFLGGQVFNSASWDDAQRYMEQSVAASPQKIVHHLDLGKVYAARGDKARAREQWETVQRLAATETNDRNYKREAQELLAKL